MCPNDSRHSAAENSTVGQAPTGGQGSDDEQRARVARLTARTIPWVMGTLSAGMREHGEGLHPSQLKVLMSMHHGACSPSELAQRMEVSMPTMSKTLAVLERRELIERTPDESDRRRVKLKMTAEGASVLRSVFDRGIGQLSAILATASPEELDSIEHGMKAIGDVFERAHPDHRGRFFGHTERKGGTHQ